MEAVRVLLIEEFFRRVRRRAERRRRNRLTRQALHKITTARDVKR